MHDFSSLPNVPGRSWFLKPVTTAGSTFTFQRWQKPRGVAMISFTAVSGGGGGGGGFTRTAGSAGGGGGGGACSGITRFVCPALFVPDTLFVVVGDGGQGGSPTVAGGAGQNSYVFLGSRAGVVAPGVVIASSTNAPGGGGAGTGAAAGTAGTVPTVATTNIIATWGQWFSTVGLVGVAGGAQTGANGTAVTAWAAIPMSPGSGGAGCTTTNFNGGAISASTTTDLGDFGYINTSICAGGVGGGAVDGNAGIRSLAPFYNSGGSGGGSNNSGQAGHGGDGGYGCGGGGGGAGATGGKGGRGGPGFVLITAW